MTDIAKIGLDHLARALAGEMSSCTVTEWRDDSGDPVEIYWRPLTGNVQSEIDQAGDQNSRVAMTVKLRARDAEGRLIFKDTALVSLMTDYDFDTIRTIAFLITTDPDRLEAAGDLNDQVDQLEKES